MGFRVSGIGFRVGLGVWSQGEGFLFRAWFAFWAQSVAGFWTQG